MPKSLSRKTGKDIMCCRNLELSLRVQQQLRARACRRVSANLSNDHWPHVHFLVWSWVHTWDISFNMAESSWKGSLNCGFFLEMKLAGVCVLDEVWIMFAVNKMLLVARFC